MADAAGLGQSTLGPLTHRGRARPSRPLSLRHSDKVIGFYIISIPFNAATIALKSYNFFHIMANKTLTLHQEDT
jgi:hypothetical protein